MISHAYFFGCWGGVGHYLWKPDMTKDWHLGDRWRGIDGHYVPKERGIVAHHLTANGGPVPPGWTVLSMIDNTVDHRGGSHATFVLGGELDLVAAAGGACAFFPRVAERVGLLAAVEETMKRGRAR